MEARIIKKYPNRRLYDTERSRYITVEDVRELLITGADIKVIDAQTEEDITRSVLIQIITEQESGKSGTFTTEMLTRFIRLSHDTAQEVFSRYFDQSMRLFLEQQHMFQEQMHDALHAKTFSEIAQHNLEMWQNMQQNFFKAAGLGTTPKSESEKGQKTPK